MSLCKFSSAALGAVLLFACGGSLQHGPSGIEQLRGAATASPKNAAAQRELAIAELFSYEGNVARSDDALERALALSPKDARLWLARGVAYDMHGQPAQALDAYLQLLAVAPSSQDEIAPHLAEIAVLAISALEGAVPGYAPRVTAAFDAALADPKLSTPARYALGSELLQLAYRRGDLAAAQRVAGQLGCVTQMRSAGPFGPRELLGFDQDYGVKPGTPLAASYDLGRGAASRRRATSVRAAARSTSAAARSRAAARRTPKRRSTRRQKARMSCASRCRARPNVDRRQVGRAHRRCASRS